MKRLFFPVIFTFLSLCSSAQITFQAAFGDTTADFGTAMVITSDGRYCLTGPSVLSGPDSNEIAVYFVSQNGDLINSSTVGLSGNDYPTSIVESDDGNFIITGYTYGSALDPTHADIFAVKVDFIDGYPIWSHVYGGQLNDMAYSIIKTPEGNYVISGMTESFGSAIQSGFAMKIDDNGDVIWTSVMGIGSRSENKSAAVMPDGTYILAGNSYNGSNSDQYITKLDTNGSVLWTYTAGTSNNEYASSVAVTDDGGFIVAGSTSNPPGNADQLVMKYDANGNVMWAKSYSTNLLDELTSVIQNTEGNFIATGSTDVDTLGNALFQLVIEEIDSAGNLVWSNTYGNQVERTMGLQILPAIGGGYVAIGNSYSFDPDGDVFFVNTDTFGMSGCDEFSIALITNTVIASNAPGIPGQNITIDDLAISMNSNLFTDQYVQNCFWDNIKIVRSSASLRLFPNPATDILNVDTDLHGGFINIYDQLGRSLLKRPFSGNKCSINTSDFTSGIYIMQLQSENSLVTGKFIKE